MWLVMARGPSHLPHRERSRHCSLGNDDRQPPSDAVALACVPVVDMGTRRKGARGRDVSIIVVGGVWEQVGGTEVGCP